MGKITEIISKYTVKASSLVAKTSSLVEKSPEPSPNVWYTNRAFQKMQTAIIMCQDEVGWLGTVDEVKGGYLITDIFVPKQTVHGTETEILPEDLANIVSEIDEPEKLLFWGHSHVNMSVSPSVQDEAQTEEYLDDVDFFIRGIYNKKGASKVDVFDTRTELIHEAVNNRIRVTPLPDGEMEQFKASLELNVVKASNIITTTKNTGDKSFRASSSSIRRNHFIK